VNPFDTNLLWVFEARKIPGGARRIVDAAKSMGYGLAAKVFDGNPADDGDYFTAPFAEIASLCKAEGVPLVGWCYLYGDKFGNLAKEAAEVVRWLRMGVPLVLDIEGEWEVSAARVWAQILSAQVLAEFPQAKSMLSFAPFWNMTHHKAYPAAELSSLCSAVMPQDYFDLGRKTTYAKQRDMVETSYREFAPYGLPVYPIGEFGKRGIGDVAAFLSLVGGKPHGWWLLDGWQDSDEMKYLAAIREERKTVQKFERIAQIVKEVK
jgi:hypothetical protein